MSGKLVLQIYEDEVPLTLIGTAKVIMGLKDDHLREVANAAFARGERGDPRLPKYCNNERHDHFNAYIGGGICLAKKYKRLFSSVDLICTTCDSNVIVDSLNYLFDHYYGGKYRAEWRRTRKEKRSKEAIAQEKATTKRRARKPKEDEPLQAPTEIKTESITEQDHPEIKRSLEHLVATETGRVSCAEPNVSNVPKDDKRGKPRAKSGGPRKRTVEAP